MLILSGDIETNPGPNQWKNLSICHWNLNGLTSHNFIKLTMLEAFISSENHDIVFISETFLNSSTDIKDPAINIEGYELARRDNPHDTKRGGVCLL